MLTIGAPLGLLGLLAVPAILGIHLLRRRFPSRPVTALFLYGPPELALATGRKPEPLRWRASLWCELAAALVATWLLADVHWAGTTSARHLIVVLDDRLRIAARLSPEENGTDSPAERLRQDLRRRMSALGPGDRVSLIASGEPPRLLAGPAAEPARALLALAAWRPAAPWHEPGEALALGADLAAKGGEIWFASDRVPDDVPATVGLIARGEARPTRVLAEVDWRRDGDGDRLVIRQVGTAPRRGILIADHLRVLPPGEDLALIPLPPELAKLGVVTVALTGPDPLPAQATVLRPDARPVRVAAAMPAKAGIERILAALPQVLTGGAAPHLVLGGPSAPGAWSLQVEPGPAPAVLGPFLTRRGHPIVADLDATGCLWSGGAPLTSLPATATVLLAGGDTVLLSEARRGPDHLLTIHADLAKGSLASHPFWPTLIAATVEARRAALPGIARPNRRLGESFAAIMPPGTVELIAPDGAQVALPTDADGAVVIPGAALAGEHLLRVDGKPVAKFQAEALDPRMGDLAAATSADRPAADRQAMVQRRRHPGETLGPLVLIALLTVAAVVFFRRENGR